MKKLLLALVISLFAGLALAADNVHLSGALVAEPCKIPDADTDIHIDMGNVIAKSLYQYQRTKSQPFTIHLQDCELSLASSVSVSFEGTADDELTSLLKLEPSSTASGVALGIENNAGNLVEVNIASPAVQLVNNDNTLEFKAFIQALPSAMANKNLAEGGFTFITKFVLNYQ